MRLNQLLELLLSLQAIARQPIAEDLIHSLQPEIDHLIHLITKLITAELAVLNLQQPGELVEELTESFAALESKFRSIIPLPLDALDINNEYLLLAEFVYTLKELGEVVTILAKSMR